MVALPPEFVLSSTLAVGAIYHFRAPEIINTSIPHYFIIVAIDGDDNYLALCTTQEEAKERHFIRHNLDFSGLVYINPCPENGLVDDTFVNCNDKYYISKTSLFDKCKTECFFYSGQVSLNHYLQIKRGIVDSYTNDLPEYLLVHPDESK